MTMAPLRIIGLVIVAIVLLALLQTLLISPG